MLPWGRGRKQPGWLAVVAGNGRFDIAHVLGQAGGKPEIRMCDSVAHENGAADALSRLATGYKLRTYRCATLLGEQDYRLLQMEAPTVPVEERVQAVRWRLKDMVDFPVQDAAVQVLDVPMEGGTNRQAAIFAVAASRAAIAACMGRFQSAKLPVEAIDIPELAQRNVAALFEEENRGLAFLLLAGGDALLTITYKGELYFSRRFDISARRLAEADEERRRQLMERLALELQRTLDNFDRQYNFISVAGLRVACEAKVDDLLPYLAENVYVPVQPTDLAIVVDFPTVPELLAPERQAQCLLAIGTALREAV